MSKRMSTMSNLEQDLRHSFHVCDITCFHLGILSTNRPKILSSHCLGRSCLRVCAQERLHLDGSSPGTI